VRPVWNYTCKAVEMIGTFEQVYLNVAVTDSEAKQSVSANFVLLATYDTLKLCLKTYLFH